MKRESTKRERDVGDGFCVSDVGILKIVIIVDCGTTSTEEKRKRRIWIYEMNQKYTLCTKEETLLGEMQQKQEMCTYAAQLEMYVHINIRVIKIQ